MVITFDIGLHHITSTASTGLGNFIWFITIFNHAFTYVFPFFHPLDKVISIKYMNYINDKEIKDKLQLNS